MTLFLTQSFRQVGAGRPVGGRSSSRVRSLLITLPEATAISTDSTKMIPRTHTFKKHYDNHKRHKPLLPFNAYFIIPHDRTTERAISTNSNHRMLVNKWKQMRSTYAGDTMSLLTSTEGIRMGMKTTKNNYWKYVVLLMETIKLGQRQSTRMVSNSSYALPACRDPARKALRVPLNAC